MDRIINVKVFGNHMTKDSNRAGVRGEGDSTNLRITFDESWDEYAKEAVFWDAYGQNPTIIILKENLLEDKTKSKRTYLVTIPAEAMARAGMLTFIIKGITVQESKAEATEPRPEEPLIGKIQVSVTGRLEVEDSPDMLAPVKPTADQWLQMQTQYNKILGDLQKVATAMEELPQFKTDMQSQVDKATERANDAFDAKLAAQVASEAATAKSVVAEEYADSAASSADSAKAYADSAAASADSAKAYADSATASADSAKAYADSATASAEAANKTANLVDLNVGSMSQELSDTKAEMEAHKASFDHPDKSITTKKIRDAAVTTEKIADGAVTEEKIAKGAVTGDKIDEKALLLKHFSYDVRRRITLNTFDGVINPPGIIDFYSTFSKAEFQIYRVEEDVGVQGGGILIVTGKIDTEFDTLLNIRQVYIADDGYIKTRQVETQDIVTGEIYTWSEWKSEYADVDDAITKTDFATNSPGSGQYGKPGIIRLGHMQGFKMIDNALVLDAASPNVIKTKASSLLPIAPAMMAYAVALATHQQIGDNYNTEDFTVVHKSKQNNESYYFPLNKDNLPVSYKAVKDALANVSGGVKLLREYTEAQVPEYGYSGWDVELVNLDMSNTNEFYGRFIVSSLNRKHADGIFNVYINKTQAIYDVEWETLSNKATRYPVLMIGDETVEVGKLLSVWMRADAQQPMVIQCHMINSSDDTIVSGGYGATEEPFDGVGFHYLRATSPKDRLTQIEQKLEQL